MIIDSVAFEFFALECERGLAGCSQVNRGIVFVCDELSENPADLKTGRIVTSRSIITFDGFIDALESADPKRHLTGKFFKHVSQVLKIATDKELRLLRRDVERAVLSIDGVRDLLYLRFKA